MEKGQPEGSIGFYLPEPNEEGWRSDRQRYQLPAVHFDRYRLKMWKSEDGLLSVELHNVVELPVFLQAPLPAGSEPILCILIWGNGSVELHLGGNPAAIAQLPDVEMVRKAADN
jgi:hypothetical protein